MVPELWTEWHDSIMFAVPEELRRASGIGNFGFHVCQLLTLPTFDNSVSWDVTDPRKRGAQLRLYRTCWLRHIDLGVFRSLLERLRHPRPYRPTVEVGWCPLDPDRFDALIDRFKATPIPLVASEDHAGTDGTSYELAFGQSFIKSRIHWWESLPEAWSPLEPIVNEMFTLFEETWNRGPVETIDRKATP